MGETEAQPARFNRLGWLWAVPLPVGAIGFVLMSLVTDRLPWLENAAQRGGASLSPLVFALFAIPLATLLGWIFGRSRRVFLAVFWILLLYPLAGALVYHVRYWQ